MPQRQGPAVALTAVYAKPELPPRPAPGGCGKLPGARWYWVLLGAGWVGTAVLASIVLWLLQRHSGSGPVLSQGTEAPANTCSWETCRTSTGRWGVPEFKCSLNCFQLQLRQRLCEQGSHQAAGVSACRLCPAGWQPLAAKCYWLSTRTGAWDEAEANCANQRSQLLTLESVEEKTFVGEMMGNTPGAWTGLSTDQGRGTEWTWRDGSPLQGDLSPVLGPAKADACAAIRRGQLRSHACSVPLHWICQKEATEV